MENPYQAPQEVGGGQVARHGSGYVQAARIVAILMAVHGSLTFLMGGFYLLTGTMMMGMAVDADQRGASQMAGMLVVFGVLGFPAMASGVLQVVAGIRGFFFRSRTMGIAALAAGFLACTTIYCAPSSILLGIGGLIVYLNSDVAEAFAMREQGATPDQIVVHFSTR